MLLSIAALGGDMLGSKEYLDARRKKASNYDSSPNTTVFIKDS